MSLYITSNDLCPSAWINADRIWSTPGEIWFHFNYSELIITLFHKIKCSDGISHIDDGINSKPRKVLNEINDIL